MKKVIFIIIPSLVLAIIIFLFLQLLVLKKFDKGALQITTNPTSKIYLNGKYIGVTPLAKSKNDDMLTTGEYTLRLVPAGATLPEYQEKITITKSVLTVIDRKFGNGALSEGSVISLSPIRDGKKAEIFVSSFPTNADIFIDDSQKGVAPQLIKNVAISDHSIKVKKDGYKEKIIRVQTPPGYRLQVIAYLAANETLAVPVASVSAVPEESTKSMVRILTTPTGFLRVRDQAGVAGGEIGRVIPGESYELISEEAGWVQIKLTNGKEGWVSSQYTQKQ